MARFHLPAEFEPHRSTWLSWPHNEATWPGSIAAVEAAIVQIVAALTPGETVHINVQNAASEQKAAKLFSDAGIKNLPVFHSFPTNDAWCRDYGALFVRDKSPSPVDLTAVCCEYNAWGRKYPPWDADNRIAGLIADYLEVPRVSCDLVLEGGSIDVNGAGLLLTTEQCLLNPNRNPALSQERIENKLRDLFGVEKILWLEEGIAGDDTDGHIDNLSRFINTDTLVTVVESDPGDINHRPLQDNLERLGTMTSVEGRPLRIVQLPMPSPLYHNGQRLPASYANFYIANELVLVPVYQDPRDQQALKILAECFPDRRIQGIDCRWLIRGLGGIHCLTSQVPEMAI